MKAKRIYFLSRKNVLIKKWRLAGVTLEERKRRLKPNRLLHNFYISIASYKVLSKEEIECARRVLKRILKRKVEIEILVRSFLPRTKKPAEVRMGKGKGKINTFVALVKPGQFFCRVQGAPKEQVLEAFLALKKKMSVDINFS